MKRLWILFELKDAKFQHSRFPGIFIHSSKFQLSRGRRGKLIKPTYHGGRPWNRNHCYPSSLFRSILETSSSWTEITPSQRHSLPRISFSMRDQYQLRLDSPIFPHLPSIFFCINMSLPKVSCFSTLSSLSELALVYTYPVASAARNLIFWIAQFFSVFENSILSYTLN